MSERTDGSVVLPGVPWQELARRYEGALRKTMGSLRCVVTMNLCGTDTWNVGKPCQCQSCRAWLPTYELLNTAPSATTVETCAQGGCGHLRECHTPRCHVDGNCNCGQFMPQPAPSATTAETKYRRDFCPQCNREISDEELQRVRADGRRWNHAVDCKPAPPSSAGEATATCLACEALDAHRGCKHARAEVERVTRERDIECSKRETAERRAWQSRERMEAAERERDAAAKRADEAEAACAAMRETLDKIDTYWRNRANAEDVRRFSPREEDVYNRDFERGAFSAAYVIARVAQNALSASPAGAAILRERDELRAEVERLRGVIDSWRPQMRGATSVAVTPGMIHAALTPPAPSDDNGGE